MGAVVFRHATGFSYAEVTSFTTARTLSVRGYPMYGG